MIALLLTASLLQADMNPIEHTAAFQDRKEWFASFLRNTDQKEMQRKTTLRMLQEDFPQVWERIQNSDYPFISLFVGVGSGGMEIPLLKEFEKARGDSSQLVTYCEDPSMQLREEFLTQEQVELESRAVEYNLLPFQAPSYTPPQADLALASHSWYFIDGWKKKDEEGNTLIKFASLVSERSGIGIITLQSKMGARYKLNAPYAELVGSEKELVAEEIIEELNRLGIRHAALPFESRLSVADCFEGDLFKPSEEGKNLLSFLLLASWDALPLDVKEQVTANLLRQVEETGKKEITLRDIHIVISN